MCGKDHITEYHQGKYTEDDLETAIEEIDKTMKEFKIEENIKTYRITDTKYFGNLKVGDQIQNKLYWSSSLKEEETMGFLNMNNNPIMFEIEVPAGTEGFYIGDMSEYPEEKELLLSRNLTYEVLDIEDYSYGNKNMNKVKIRVTNDPDQDRIIDHKKLINLNAQMATSDSYLGIDVGQARKLGKISLEIKKRRAEQLAVRHKVYMESEDYDQIEKHLKPQMQDLIEQTTQEKEELLENTRGELTPGEEIAVFEADEYVKRLEELLDEYHSKVQKSNSPDITKSMEPPGKDMATSENYVGYTIEMAREKAEAQISHHTYRANKIAEEFNNGLMMKNYVEIEKRIYDQAQETVAGIENEIEELNENTAGQLTGQELLTIEQAIEEANILKVLIDEYDHSLGKTEKAISKQDLIKARIEGIRQKLENTKNGRLNGPGMV